MGRVQAGVECGGKAAQNGAQGGVRPVAQKKSTVLPGFQAHRDSKLISRIIFFSRINAVSINSMVARPPSFARFSIRGWNQPIPSIVWEIRFERIDWTWDCTENAMLTGDQLIVAARVELAGRYRFLSPLLSLKLRWEPCVLRTCMPLVCDFFGITKYAK